MYTLKNRYNLYDTFSKDAMPSTDLEVETVDRPSLESDRINLHSSFLPLYQDSLKKGRYLLTIESNHRPVNKNTLNFQQGTKKLMMHRDRTDLCFTQTMTVFPYIQTAHDEKDKFQLNCSFLMQPNQNEVGSVKEKLRQSDKAPYKPKNMARQLNDNEYNDLVDFFKGIERINLTNGDDVITFCKKNLGLDKLSIVDVDNDHIRDLYLNEKEEFLTYFKQNEVSVYRNLFFTFQSKNKIRFAYIDGQHRSLGFFLQYLQYAPANNGSTLSAKESLSMESENISRKDLAIDTAVMINLIKPKKVSSNIELSTMFRAESNFIHRQNSNTMGNMEIDQLLNLMSTVYNQDTVNEFDCKNFLAYRLKGNPSSKTNDKDQKEKKWIL